MATSEKLNQLIKTFLGSDSSISTILSDFDTRSYTVVKASSDGVANTATTEYVVYIVPKDSRLTGVKYVTSGTITAHNTNYATLTVAKRDGAGGSGATEASQTTKIAGGSVDVAANVPMSLTLTTTTADLLLSAGNVLTFAIAKAASGVVVPTGLIEITTTEI